VIQVPKDRHVVPFETCYEDISLIPAPVPQGLWETLLSWLDTGNQSSQSQHGELTSAHGGNTEDSRIFR